MLRLVLDTNIVLDLFHFADPAALPLLQALESGRACCFTDAACLDELARVVTYPAFGMSEEAGKALCQRYRRLASLDDTAMPLPRLPVCRDRDDQKFLELAARCRADLLVSKDKALLRLKGRTNLGFRILAPKAASESLG